MALPKQVQQIEEQTSELEKQLYGDTTPTEKPVAEVVQPEAEQSAAPVPEPQPAPAPVEEAKKPEKEDDQNWKQKYKTLQGMYDAEVPRLHQQVKELMAEMSTLKETIDTKAKEVEQAKEEANYERLKNLVTDEDRQEFGEDLIEVQRKVAREETAELYKQLEAIRAENDKLREQLTETGTQVTTASFEQRLNRLVPDFETVNVDPSWIAWLNEQDPMLRAPRMVAAQDAYSKGDAEAVAYYVDLWRKSQAPEPKKQDSDKELESQIQPSKSAASEATPAPKGQYYTSDQVRNMFLKVTQLGKMGRVDEARKLEAEIDAAYMQGRVRG